MTRRHTPRPVWEWVCDKCGQTGGELAFSQSSLPTMEEMTARGWYIAPRRGDLCPTCVAKRTPPDPATAGSFHVQED